MKRETILGAEVINFTLSSGKKISAPVRRSGRNVNIRIRLLPPDNFLISAPLSVSFSSLQENAPRFLPWLEKICNKLSTSSQLPFLPEYIEVPLLEKKFVVERNPSLAYGRRLAAGSSSALLYAAGNQRIIAALQAEKVTLAGAEADELLCAAALRAFFHKLAIRLLPPHITTLARSAKYGEIEVRIKDQRTRWGSCSVKQSGAIPRINLNWRALLLPCQLLNHLCWHELAHIRQMNHSSAFYEELALHSPDSKKCERALTMAWRDLGAWTASQG